MVVANVLVKLAIHREAVGAELDTGKGYGEGEVRNVMG